MMPKMLPKLLVCSSRKEATTRRGQKAAHKHQNCCKKVARNQFHQQNYRKTETCLPAILSLQATMMGNIVLFKGLRPCRRPPGPKPWKIWIFAPYGRWRFRNRCKMMPQGVGSFSTPGKTLPGNSIFGPFSRGAQILTFSSPTQLLFLI